MSITKIYLSVEEATSLDFDAGSGIYLICNSALNRVYVGASWTSVRQRWIAHISNLTTGRHANSKMQHDWNTCTPDAFGFCILERESNEQKARIAEAKWMHRMKNYFDLYNSFVPEHPPEISEEFKNYLVAGLLGSKQQEYPKNTYISEDYREFISSAFLGRSICLPITIYGQHDEREKVLTPEEREYLLLLKELGIKINIEQDRLADKYKIGNLSIYKHQLLTRLKELHSNAMRCIESIEQIEKDAYRMGLQLDINNWKPKRDKAAIEQSESN